MRRTLAVLAIAISACTSATDGTTTTAVTGTTATSTSSTTTTTRAPVTTTTQRVAVAGDFTVTLVVLEKQCFGSAGCSIEARPEIGFTGIPRLANGTLIFDVSGGEDGVLTFNAELTGDQYTVRDIRISTASESDELTVEVTRFIPD